MCGILFILYNCILVKAGTLPESVQPLHAIEPISTHASLHANKSSEENQSPYTISAVYLYPPTTSAGLEGRDTEFIGRDCHRFVLFPSNFGIAAGSLCSNSASTQDHVDDPNRLVPPAAIASLDPDGARSADARGVFRAQSVPRPQLPCAHCQRARH